MKKKDETRVALYTIPYYTLYIYIYVLYTIHRPGQIIQHYTKINVTLTRDLYKHRIHFIKKKLKGAISNFDFILQKTWYCEIGTFL